MPPCRFGLRPARHSGASLTGVGQFYFGDSAAKRVRITSALTLKAWMEATHFQTKTLSRVRTEMSSHVLAYNLKRVMQMIGVGSLVAAIRAAGA